MAASKRIRYEVADRIATITFDRPDRLNALSPAMIRELRAGVRRGRSRPRRLDPARHRQRARVLRRRRRHRDPRRRPRRLRRAVPVDVRAVGSAAGGHAAVPHDDEADPHRGQRPVLRRRARLGHDRRHRHRVGPGRVLRSAREHRAGVGPRDGAARACAADEHRDALRAHRQARAHERATRRTSSAWSPRSSSTTGCSSGRARSRAS